MWLVLCGSNDIPGLWAYLGLRARGLAPLELVSAEVLACALRWEHRLGADGVSIAITLADGRRISNDTVQGVLNRLLSVPPEPLRWAAPADRDYATQELTAFYLSWLYALPQPVSNRPTPQGLCGQWRHVSEWVWLASQAELPVPDYRQSGRDLIDERFSERRLVASGTPVYTVLVVAGQTAGAAAPSSILAGCRRLAELADTALLGVEFAPGSAGPWTFAGATPFPDLRLGGEALLDILATALAGGQEAHR